MKKILLLTLIFFTIGPAFSQNWCPPGATWNYTIQNGYMPYETGTLRLQYTNTVIVNSVVCKHLQGSFTGIWNCMPTPTWTCAVMTNPNWCSYDTYENNGVVYVAFGSRFDTICDFNADIGDKWTKPFYTSNCLNFRQVYTVTDTGHVTINGFYLKTIKVGNSKIFTEKIISLSGSLFSYHMCQIDQTNYFDFTCYQDDNFGFYQRPNSRFCYYNPVGLNEQSQVNLDIKLYPNPNNGSFQLELQQPTEFRIYNSFGETVYAASIKQTGNVAIEAPEIAPGAYILEARTADGQGKMKFIRQ